MGEKNIVNVTPKMISKLSGRVMTMRRDSEEFPRYACKLSGCRLLDDGFLELLGIPITDEFDESGQVTMRGYRGKEHTLSVDDGAIIVRDFLHGCQYTVLLEGETYIGQYQQFGPDDAAEIWEGTTAAVTKEQIRAAQGVRATLSGLNFELQQAAKAGITVKLDILDVTHMGCVTRALLVNASMKVIREEEL